MRRCFKIVVTGENKTDWLPTENRPTESGWPRIPPASTQIATSDLRKTVLKLFFFKLMLAETFFKVFNTSEIVGDPIKQNVRIMPKKLFERHIPGKFFSSAVGNTQ